MKHVCVWCTLPVTRPQWLIASGMKFTYHPSCHDSLQEVLKRNEQKHPTPQRSHPVPDR